MILSPPFSLALESQLQALYAAAASTTDVVNAQGNTVAGCLQDIPDCVREVTGHEVREGATIAPAVVQTRFRNDLWTLHPAFPEDEEQADFEELVGDLDMDASIIGGEVDTNALISNVFADE